MRLFYILQLYLTYYYFYYNSLTYHRYTLIILYCIGACCVDDYTAKKLGCDMLIHYGHSCLIPINITNMNNIIVMYIFVEIYFDEVHLIECLKSLANTHYSTTDNTNNSDTDNTPATTNIANNIATNNAHNVDSNTNTTDTNNNSTASIDAINNTTITATNTDTHSSKGKRIALLGTVQFVSILFKVQEKLIAEGIYDR